MIAQSVSNFKPFAVAVAFAALPAATTATSAAVLVVFLINKTIGYVWSGKCKSCANVCMSPSSAALLPRPSLLPPLPFLLPRSLAFHQRLNRVKWGINLRND